MVLSSAAVAKTTKHHSSTTASRSKSKSKSKKGKKAWQAKGQKTITNDRTREIQEALIRDRIVCVSGNVEHLHRRTQRPKSRCKLRSAHLFQDHVGQQQVYLIAVTFAVQQRFTAVSRFQHGVTVLGQHLPHQCSNTVL